MAVVVSLNTSSLAQLAPLAVLLVLYARRTRTLAGRARALPRWRQGCFYGGLALLAATLLLLAASSRELLYARTVEQLLIGDLAALLIVLGLTPALVTPRSPAAARGGPWRALAWAPRAISHPVVAFTLWAVDLFVWQARSPYESALRHPGLHVFEHATLLLCGINMWICLLGPAPSPSWFGERAKLAYVLAVRLTAGVLANILLWSGSVFYGGDLVGDAQHHLSPIADQNIAGAIMLGESAVVLLCLLYWLFRRAAPADAGTRPTRRDEQRLRVHEPGHQPRPALAASGELQLEATAAKRG